MASPVSSLDNVDIVADRLEEGEGTLALLINDKALAEQVRTGVDSAVSFLDNVDTALADGAELQIVPAIAGG